MPQKHSRLIANERYVWFTERLWRLTENLPVKAIFIENIREFDLNCWFNEKSLPTCREVAIHAKKIYEADLSYPIILSAEGFLMDGGHRIAKAWLLGLKEISAVRFEINPDPDEIIAAAK